MSEPGVIWIDDVRDCLPAGKFAIQDVVSALHAKGKTWALRHQVNSQLCQLEKLGEVHRLTRGIYVRARGYGQTN